MTEIAPNARLEPECSGDLVPAVCDPDLQEKFGTGMPDRHQDAIVAKKEVLRSARDLPRNMISQISRLDRLGYALENRIAANPNYPFELVVVFTTVVLVVVGCLYHYLAARPSVAQFDVFGSNSWADGIYLALSLVIAAGVDDSVPDKLGLRFLYVSLVIFGLVMFAAVVGFMTNKIDDFLVSIAEGYTKVAAETQHVLNNFR